MATAHANFYDVVETMQLSTTSTVYKAAPIDYA